MDLALKGKVAIVTGGARGIGKACVQGYVKEGASVVIGDLEVEGAQKVAESATKGESKVIAVKCDVTKKTDADNLAAKTLEKFGRIDILVNNVGIAKMGPIVEYEEADFDRLFDVNVKGTYLCTKAVLHHMIAERSGKIVNIASRAGKEGFALASVYCATKSAVLALTQSWAKELAEYDINVNAVCPGNVPTDFHGQYIEFFSRIMNVPESDVFQQFVNEQPLKRAQPAEEIADFVLILSSEVSRDVTGQGINVSGGLQML